MKILTCAIAILGICVATAVDAKTMYAEISQQNKSLPFTRLQSGDSLSVKFDLKRTPIYRGSVWWSYVLRCGLAASQIEFPDHGKIKVSHLPVILSNDEDGQQIGKNMDESGFFIVTNKSSE